MILGNERSSRNRAIDLVDIGHHYVVLGNSVLTKVAGEDILFGWVGVRGRAPTLAEQKGVRAPYRAPVAPPVLVEDLPDEALDDAEALRLCRLQQQREPVDLLNAA